MFMLPDDRLIIMDDLFNRLLPEEFIMLANAGVKTVFYQGGFQWRDMQPSADAPLDWSAIDGFVDNCRRAGIKALIPFACSLPEWKSNDWYYSREASSLAHCIASYTNPQTALDLDNLAAETITRYGGSDVQLIYSMPADGEFPTAFWPTEHDIDFPHETLAKFIVERQRLLVLQHNEIWTAFHPYTCPAWWDTVYDELKTAFPNSIHRQIVYTYWPHEQSNLNVRRYVDAQITRGIGVFVGSEWATGLRANMRFLQERGLYGFLTCPNHSSHRQKRLLPWQLVEIEWAVKELSNYAKL